MKKENAFFDEYYISFEEAKTEGNVNKAINAWKTTTPAEDKEKVISEWKNNKCSLIVSKAIYDSSSN